MFDEAQIKGYLDMQHQKYQERASVAQMTPHGVLPGTDAVVGSYIEQERFPYDENILKHFHKNPAECSILEYGCGPGRNLLRLAKKFNTVAGVDISEQNIENAKILMELNNLSNVIFYHTTGDNIPAESHQFDLVFEVICLQHICSYTIRQRILSDMARVCKKNGLVVCQFGFNKVIPPNTHYVDYFANQLVGVADTNGWADCCVLDEKNIISDFYMLDMETIEVWHTDKVLDENHDNWIWICGRKK